MLDSASMTPHTMTLKYKVLCHDRHYMIGHTTSVIHMSDFTPKSETQNGSK